ncbi:MAG: AmmeMemoRadiSam system protein B [Dehalococcoidia bacterium]
MLRGFERQGRHAEDCHRARRPDQPAHRLPSGWTGVRGALAAGGPRPARAAEVVVIFGTDHHRSPGALTLTRPTVCDALGRAAGDLDAVDAMAAELGEEAAFAEELHHRSEHSVELAAVWLHHARGGEPCTVIPVLCGHPMPYLLAGSPPGAGTPAGRALAALRAATTGRRTVVVAAADLAHVGPAFGDQEPFTAAAKRAVRAADDEVAACDEDAGRAARRGADRRPLSHLRRTPIALTLALTGPVRRRGDRLRPVPRRSRRWRRLDRLHRRRPAPPALLTALERGPRCSVAAAGQPSHTARADVRRAVVAGRRAPVGPAAGHRAVANRRVTGAASPPARA